MYNKFNNKDIPSLRKESYFYFAFIFSGLFLSDYHITACSVQEQFVNGTVTICHYSRGE